MEHTALAVTDKLIRSALAVERPITPMQAQKLTYFCHAWSLGLGHGPLFQDAVEAWRYGPVIRAVYHALKNHGRAGILEPLLEHAEKFDQRDDRLIRVVWERYGHLDGLTLSRITHAPGSPWDQVYQRDPCSQIIHEHTIRDYYAGIIGKQVA